MQTRTANLYLIEDLDDRSRTNNLADADVHALHTVANWITSFVASPNKDIGRAGPVCPFVPGGLERRTIWLAPERVSNQSVAEVIRLLDHYKRVLLRAEPVDGEDADYKAVVVVFTDLSPDDARSLADDAQVAMFKRASYADDGIVMGDFHERNQGSAIYNASFHPFSAPVPFWLMRRTVIDDWKFFLDNPDWLGLWAKRFGELAVPALATELRRTNWRHSQTPSK
jgi:hypothetical protein